MMGGVAFEALLAELEPVIERVVEDQARAHPYLREDDLEQEARGALWEVYQKYHAKPPSEVQRIGVRAIERRTVSVVRRRYAFGEPERVRSEAALAQQEATWRSVEEVEDAIYDEQLAQAIESMLGRMAGDWHVAAFRELMDPSVEMLQALRRGWQKQSWEKLVARAIRKRFGVSRNRARRLVADIQRVVRKELRRK